MRRSLLVLMLLVALVAGACNSSDDDDANPSEPAGEDAGDADAAAGPAEPQECSGERDSLRDAAEGAYPVSVEAGNGTVEVAEQPVCIVSLSATTTEILFAIGAGDFVLAVDDQSNYPPEAPTSDLSGYTPNLEAIAGLDPDLVIVSNDTDNLVAGLSELEIPVVVHGAPTSLDGTYDQIEALGELVGRSDEAGKLVAGMRSDLDAVAGSIPAEVRGATYYYELDNTYYSVTSSTFIGSAIGLLGLENIADPADEAGGGYPQLTAEYIIEADPDYIFLADAKCCGESAETLAARDGWSGLTAVAERRVVELDDDIASRWGPRIVDLLQVVADALSGESGSKAEAA